jgi:deoxyribodipyrimidine photo-lyase
MPYGVVWFKRDLRVADHAALAAAARNGPVLCLYVVEPSLWAQPDAARQHYEFIIESLRDVYRDLRKLGGRLHVVTGEVIDVLSRLHAAKPFTAIYAHEETGNRHTYARDLAVGRWCARRGVGWHEYPQFGVVRRLADRDRWQVLWENFIAQPQVELHADIVFAPLPWPDEPPPHAQALGLDAWQPPGRQAGGRAAGLSVLAEFLDERSGQYRGGISSPLSAPNACSRLSPYLAYGCLGLREVVQATRLRKAQLPAGDRRVPGLTAFISRLHWHCHFIQKLESEPGLEHANLHRGYDGLREDDWNAERFATLMAGRTGWPLVDACVAMLRENGWLNFRMRAMLVSVAAYPLWLHWRPVGLWLARQFLDYEPGIHWSQMQMQSGTTGINVPRIYNPLKQARDHDPKGVFVRRWLPHLRRVPEAWIFEPWRMPADLRTRHGLADTDLPTPLVDLESATREAKTRLFALRARPEIKAAKAAIVTRHGSRKRSTSAGKKAKEQHDQLSLDF